MKTDSGTILAAREVLHPAQQLYNFLQERISDMTQGEEKREFPRLPLDVRVNFMENAFAKSKDISSGGICLISEEALEDGKIYKLSFPGIAVPKIRYRRHACRGPLVTATPSLEGLAVNGKLGIAYSKRCLGCGWNTGEGPVCQVLGQDAVALAEGIILFALTE